MWEGEGGEREEGGALGGEEGGALDGPAVQQSRYSPGVKRVVSGKELQGKYGFVVSGKDSESVFFRLVCGWYRSRVFSLSRILLITTSYQHVM